MGKWLLFGFVAWLTGSPLLAVVALLLLSGAGYGYLFGRLGVPRALDRWLAIRRLARVVETNPYDARARAELGRLLLEAGHPARAIEHLEAARTRAPEVPETLYHLGAARLEVGDEAGGQALIAAALDRDPRLGYGAPYLTLADHYLAHGDPAAALPHLERFREVHASSVQGRYKLAQAYLATGQPARARLVLDEAIQAYRGAPAFKRRDERLWRLRTGWLRWRLPG